MEWVLVIFMVTSGGKAAAVSVPMASEDICREAGIKALEKLKPERMTCLRTK